MNSPLPMRPRAALCALAMLGLAAGPAPPTGRHDLSGVVLDAAGRPLTGATVMVYTAKVRQGTSPYCPSCYPDCGKRRRTDGRGRFVLPSLSDSLLFRILVMARGHEPKLLGYVDPLAGPVEARLERRDPGSVPRRFRLHGRVLGPGDTPVEGAVVEPIGFRRANMRRFGAIPGKDPLAITDERGEFVLAAREPEATWYVRVRPRDLAPEVFADVAPGRPAILRVVEGATVVGRVLHDGKALAGVGVGLVAIQRSAEHSAGAYEVGTDDSGRFSFVKVAPQRGYHVYGLMQSLGTLGAVAAESLWVGADGDTARAGDLVVRPGRRLCGRVALDAVARPPGLLRVLVSRHRAWDIQTATADSSGWFELAGLPEEELSLSVRVPGYRLAPGQRFSDPYNPGYALRIPLREDLDDLEVLLERDSTPARGAAPR